MSFCPVPHTFRDQVWLSLGASIGVLVSYSCAPRASNPAANTTTITTAPPGNVSPVAHGPVRVCVEFKDVNDPEKFKELYKGVVKGTRMTDKGCVQYDLLQSQKDPKQFRMIEAWETQEDLDRHGGLQGHPQRPHMLLKRAMQESPMYKGCGAATTLVDLTFVEVPC